MKGRRKMTKKTIERSRSSSSSAVATDTPTYEMVIRSCRPQRFLNPSPWRLRSVGCLALSLFFKTLLFLARKTCRYAQYITLLVGGSNGSHRQVCFIFLLGERCGWHGTRSFSWHPFVLMAPARGATTIPRWERLWPSIVVGPRFIEGPGLAPVMPKNATHPHSPGHLVSMWVSSAKLRVGSIKQANDIRTACSRSDGERRRCDEFSAGSIVTVDLGAIIARERIDSTIFHAKVDNAIHDNGFSSCEVVLRLISPERCPILGLERIDILFKRRCGIDGISYDRWFIWSVVSYVHLPALRPIACAECIKKASRTHIEGIIHARYSR